MWRLLVIYSFAHEIVNLIGLIQPHILHVRMQHSGDEMEC